MNPNDRARRLGIRISTNRARDLGLGTDATNRASRLGIGSSLARRADRFGLAAPAVPPTDEVPPVDDQEKSA